MSKHHTVATMLAGMLTVAYCVYILSNVVMNNTVPDGAIFTAFTNAILALGLKGYYSHLKKSKKAENIDE